MSKFKVGDKVRISRDSGASKILGYNNEYVIVGVRHKGGSYVYKLLGVTIIEVYEIALIATTDTAESVQSSDNNGGKTDYYQLPEWVKDADDFAEWRGMDFFQGNILKSVWCFNTQRHSGTNEERELNKIIHYAQKRLNKIRKEKGNE